MKHASKAPGMTGIIIILATAFLIFHTPIADAKKPFEGMKFVVSLSGSSSKIALDYIKPVVKKELGIKLQYDMTPPAQVYRKHMMEFSTKASSAQLIRSTMMFLADYAMHVEPLAPLVKKYNINLHVDDIVPQFRNLSTKWAGIWYYMPMDGDQRQMYYNRIAFEREENQIAFKKKYGYDLRPPQTFEEYADMAEFFNERDWDGDGEIEYGTAEHLKRGRFAFWAFKARFAAYGGVYFDQKMNPLINTPNGLYALKNLIRTQPYMAPGAYNFGSPEVKDAIARGNVALGLSWSSGGRVVMDPKASDMVGKVWVEMTPGGKLKDGTINRRPGVGGWFFAIPKYITDKQKEAAIKVMEIYYRPELRDRRFLEDACAEDPWAISFLQSKRFQNMWPDYPEYSKQYAKICHETLKYGMPDMQIRGTHEYMIAAEDEILAALTGKKSPEKALSDMEAAWNKITDRLGRGDQIKQWRNQLSRLSESGIRYIPFDQFVVR
ncbi:MAG: extracellular solute-binding protein [Deltaproteobacteria bacterium]|nr:extracellular solute-binding protein [Deltaproteobacteria bacterium]MBW2154665.1 extracellular solute-binding protein [Deltaproteobacteria bacterium]